MGISFRKRIKIGEGTYLNVSKKGVSVSKKVGNVTITAQNKNGKISAKCSITIVHEPITINMSSNISGTKSQQTVLEWNSSSIPAGAKSIKMSWSCGVTNAISDRRYYWDFIENGNKNSWQTMRSLLILTEVQQVLVGL